MGKLRLVITPADMSTGQKIRLMRVAAGLNQIELSLLLKCSQGSVSKLENEELQPTMLQLVRMRDIFAISADSFLDGEIDYKTIARKFSNHRFSLRNYITEPEPELPLEKAA